jgi:hypothetical protein
MQVAAPAVEVTDYDRDHAGARFGIRILRFVCVRHAVMETVARARLVPSETEKVLSILLFTQQTKLIMIDELFWVCRTLIADLARLGSFR